MFHLHIFTSLLTKFYFFSFYIWRLLDWPDWLCHVHHWDVHFHEDWPENSAGQASLHRQCGGGGNRQVWLYLRFWTVAFIWPTYDYNQVPFPTGIAFLQMKTTQISYVIGTLSFVDTPNIYEEGANVEGKVGKRDLHFPFILTFLHLFANRRGSCWHNSLFWTGQSSSLQQHTHRQHAAAPVCGCKMVIAPDPESDNQQWWHCHIHTLHKRHGREHPPRGQREEELKQHVFFR